jgi:Ca2+-binding RTX toxin-like protein
MAIAVGTNFDDVIDGGWIGPGGPLGAGNDTVSAFDGDDAVYGLAGNDLLGGDQGNDRLYGGDDDDTLYGGAGRDSLFGDNGDDLAYGEGGVDRLFGGCGYDTLYGGAADDSVYGDRDADLLFGGAGNDKLYGGDEHILDAGNGGSDVLNGGLGNDTLRGDNASVVPVLGIGFDVFEWSESSVSGISTASNVEVDTVLDFQALPTVFDGLLGIDHIDLSQLISVEDWLDDPSRIKIVNPTLNDGFLQVLVDTNDDAKSAYDLKINVFTNSDVQWNVGPSGNAFAEIWIGG